MKCYGWFVLLLFCLPALCSAEQLAQEGGLSQVFARLQRGAAETNSLTSDFVQEKHLSIFKETLTSHGRFYYQKPDKLRWELLTPVVSGFVLRGRTGERWNSLSKETRSFQIDKDPIMGIVAQQLLAWAKVDIEWLQSRYRIELVCEQPVRLQLFPLNEGEAGFIERLKILFTVDSTHVEQVEMHETGGDMTLLHFANARLNQPLPVDAFLAPEF